MGDGEGVSSDPPEPPLDQALALSWFLTLKAPTTTAADDKFWDIYLNFQKNKV